MKPNPRMVLHCSRCGKTLLNKPAGWIADMAFGPVCFAKIKGATVQIQESKIVRDDKTVDMFEVKNKC